MTRLRYKGVGCVGVRASGATKAAHSCGQHGSNRLTFLALTRCWTPGSSRIETRLGKETGRDWAFTPGGGSFHTSREAGLPTGHGDLDLKSFDRKTVVLISAIEHYAYCPRQCALIHCDGVWNDNPHTVKGERAHRRVDSGAHRQERGRRVLRAIPLWSERLGLSGRADAVEIEPGRVVPVEYKAGVAHGNAAELQLCAQALCLEEMLGVPVQSGYVWYGGPRRKVEVALDDALRAEVCRIIEEIRIQLRTGALPTAPNDNRCPECQLKSHCLPDVANASRRVGRYMADIVFACDT